MIAVLLAALLPIESSAAATVWYVRNNAPAGGNGTQSSPFNQLASAETQSQPGDTIFLFAGDQTTANQNAGITLKDGQSLIGNGNPKITNRSGPAIRLANDNTLRGLTIIDSKDQGIAGQAKTSGLTVDNVTVQRSGAEALLLPDASGIVSIDAAQFDTGPGDLVKIATTSNLSLQVTNSHFAHTTLPAGNDALRVVGGGSGNVRRDHSARPRADSVSPQRQRRLRRDTVASRVVCGCGAPAQRAPRMERPRRWRANFQHAAVRGRAKPSDSTSD